jgi:hypothetical protein
LPAQPQALRPQVAQVFLLCHLDRFAGGGQGGFCFP